MVATPIPVILKPPIGMFAVGVVWPSLVMQVERPVAKSALSWFATVELIVVPVTKGSPVPEMTKVPEPLKELIAASYCFG